MRGSRGGGSCPRSCPPRGRKRDKPGFPIRPLLSCLPCCSARRTLSNLLFRPSGTDAGTVLFWIPPNGGLERDFLSPAPMTRGELAGSWSHAASRGPKGADDGHLDLSASKERLTIGEDGRRDQQGITISRRSLH